MTVFAIRRYVGLICLALMLTVPSFARNPSSDSQLLAPDAGMDATAVECLAKVAAPLEKSGGKLTPEVRKAYIDWSWGTIIRALQLKQRYVSAETVADVQADPTLKDAVCGAVYPPDPSIVQNYDALRTQMGSPFTKKYRSLAIGIAVARRVKGVELDPGGIGRENQVPIWAYSPLQRPSNGSETQLVAHIADFMRSKGCSALDLFNSPDLQQTLTVYLAANHVEKPSIDEVSRSVRFGELLKNAMILLGKRPAARSPRPGCIEWLKHLIAINESRPASTPQDNGHAMPWPLCSFSGTPWPLLMGLSHPIPLDEAKYLWEAFQGEHGPDRFHTYGPYRDDLTAMPDMLQPSHWFWNAVPDQIVHGGECMPISLATVDLYSAVGKPATDAAQPGHANLISYQKDGAAWMARIEQDFAGGAHVTFSQWYFDDPPRPELHFRDLFGWPGAEYHLGLAAGMNLGLASYIDTRIAARIFDVLPGAARRTIGLKLLEGALEQNPFNPEIWYRMGGETSDSRDALVLAKAVKDHDPQRLVLGEPCAPLEAFIKSGGSGPANDDMNAYWNVVLEFLARNTILARGAPQDEQTLYDAYNFLKNVPGMGAGELASFTKRFVFKSPDAEAAEAKADLKLAEMGDSFGCMRMGQRYLDGDGVPRDETKAREYLTQAARQGEQSAADVLESLAIPLPNDGVEVAASSTYSPTQDVHHLINGAGMNGSVHDNSGPAATMWQTVDNPPVTPPAPGLPPSPAWVRFNFPQPRAFDEVEIWNHNQANLTQRGFRKLRIYGSWDGKSWSALTQNAELPQAGGTPSEPSVSVPTNTSGRLFKSVIIAAAATDGNFGSADYGLSAVRFVCRPINLAVPAYMIQVHASSQFSDSQSANHLIDGAGMIGEFHDNNGSAATMWTTSENPSASRPAPVLYDSKAWVRFNFSIPRYFESIRIWNGNQANFTNRGFKKMRIYGTSDGVEWFILTTTDDVQLPKATGAQLAAGTTFFNVSPERPIRSVVIIADPNEGNYGGNAAGLSAVRFILPAATPELAETTKTSVK